MAAQNSSVQYFRGKPTLAELTKVTRNTLVSHLGIEFTDIGPDYISARMPVDSRTHQPFGLLHGGASVALAETLGSIAAQYCLSEGKYAVGLEINANHIKGVKSGWVTGTARPVHVGKSTHVWEIRIADDAETLVCISRITMAVLAR